LTCRVVGSVVDTGDRRSQSPTSDAAIPPSRVRMGECRDSPWPLARRGIRPASSEIDFQWRSICLFAIGGNKGYLQLEGNKRTERGAQHDGQHRSELLLALSTEDPT
jgi:hypothetical protein